MAGRHVLITRRIANADAARAPATRPARAGGASLGTLLRPLLRPLWAEMGSAGLDFDILWREAAGSDLAAQSRLLGIRREGARKVALVMAAGAVALEIQHQAPRLIERLALVLGRGAPQAIKIAQASPRRRR